MNIYGTGYFKLSNAIFHYGLTPIQLSVYSYLVCCTGQKEKCWPAMKTIAAACGCSKNAARAATDELVRRGFIRKTATYKDEWNGKSRQTNNTYYLRELPDIIPHPQAVYREGAADGREIDQQEEATK